MIETADATTGGRTTIPTEGTPMKNITNENIAEMTTCREIRFHIGVLEARRDAMAKARNLVNHYTGTVEEANPAWTLLNEAYIRLGKEIEQARDRGVDIKIEKLARLDREDAARTSAARAS